MPGIFGAIGISPSICNRLRHEFSRGWDDIETRRLEKIYVGGHAFGEFSALHWASDNKFVAIDGEWSLYNSAENYLPKHADNLFRFVGGAAELTTTSTGNIALFDPHKTILNLLTDWTGSFPLYFCEHESGLLFSSLLRPLARAVASSRDDLGTLEFLRQGYTLMGKTPFAGIRRLLPGQSLQYRPEGRVRISEASRAWTEFRDHRAGAVRTTRVACELLNKSLHTALPKGCLTTLMMSGGWDSRMLLAAARGTRTADQLTCYSHGDVNSRELRIVERICRATRTKIRCETINDAVLDLAALKRGFERTENLIFPHWHRAGKIARESESASTFAGVYGEIIGGHYGPAMLGSGSEKIKRIVTALVSPTMTNSRANAATTTKNLLRLSELKGHWYLDPDFEQAIDHRLERLNTDIDRAVGRLVQRGIFNSDQLIEAFISEHRGSQYINAQLLSCRAHVDIAIPFANQELVAFASGIPLAMKIHNRLNRKMLQLSRPDVLRFPLAATLLPASMPIIAQEASRLVRGLKEAAHWNLHSAARGRFGVPRLGWVNFQFLRSGYALREIINDLQCDIWNRNALRSRVSEIEQSKWNVPLHPMFDQIGKIYTVDMLLR